MDVRPRAGGLTTTGSKNETKCQICWKKGEVIWYRNQNGKVVCGDCMGVKPEDALVRRADG